VTGPYRAEFLGSSAALTEHKPFWQERCDVRRGGTSSSHGTAARSALHRKWHGSWRASVAERAEREAAMWVVYVIAAAFFVACLAAAYFGVTQREEEGRAVLLSGGAPPPHDGRGRELSADELVLRLEHRIDADIRDISYDLRTPERYQRIYEQ
jgi:hypothetical protein